MEFLAFQGLPAEARKEMFVVSSEQKLQITRMNGFEVRLPQIIRMRQYVPLNALDSLLNQVLRQIPNENRIGQRMGRGGSWHHESFHFATRAFLG
jgi:hypothetical protein